MSIYEHITRSLGIVLLFFLVGFTGVCLVAAALMLFS
jgi:hypothetical protein